MDQNLLQRADIPRRSRLYGLEPCERGTIWGESLTSYLNRLGWKHGVPPRILATQEIVQFVSNNENLSTPSYFAAFSRVRAIYLNGVSEVTVDWTRQLEQLTGRTDLRYLTLLWWIGNLHSRKLLRTKPAWCPFCYAEWKENGSVIYQPLVWMLQVIQICTKHKRQLEDRCSHCGKDQSTIAVKTLPGYCTQCKMWLGLSFGLNEQKIDKDMIESQLWLTNALEELLQASLAFGAPSWEPFFANLATKGFRNLFKLTGMPSVEQWKNRNYVPTLAMILKFCYICNVTPLQIMQNHLTPLEHALESGRLYHPVWFLNEPPRLDLERCQRLLQELLDGQEEGKGVTHVAERLGCTAAAIRVHFPQECMMITKRAREFRKQRHEKYISQVCEEIRTAVFALYSQGIYPSSGSVAKMLSQPAFMRQSDALKMFHTARRELGLEP